MHAVYIGMDVHEASITMVLPIDAPRKRLRGEGLPTDHTDGRSGISRKKAQKAQAVLVGTALRTIHSSSPIRVISVICGPSLLPFVIVREFRGCPDSPDPLRRLDPV